MDILSLFEQYSKLPTQKRLNGMTKETYRTGRAYLQQYLKYLDDIHDKINMQSFSYFLLKYNNTNTRALIAHKLGPFFVWNNLLTQEEYDKISKMFRFKSNNWSDKALELQQLKEIIKQARKLSRTKLTKSRNVFLLLLLSATAGRIGQVLALKLNDIIDKGEYFEIHLPAFKKNDTNEHDKDVKLVHKDFGVGLYFFEDYLKRYLEARARVQSDDIFVTNKGKKLKDSEVRTFFAQLSKVVGYRVTPHLIRHTIGTYVANHIGVMEANRLLNHQNIQTTQKYIKRELTKIYVPPID